MATTRAAKSPQSVVHMQHEKGFPAAHRDAHLFFLARSFTIKEKDIIYIANSASDQIGKFLGLVGLVTSPIISGAATCGAIKV
jgi:hypothetical protein